MTNKITASINFKKIEELRKEMWLTQKEFAPKIGLSYSLYVSHYVPWSSHPRREISFVLNIINFLGEDKVEFWDLITLKKENKEVEDKITTLKTRIDHLEEEDTSLCPTATKSSIDSFKKQIIKLEKELQLDCK